jgi:NAD(P)-dependent dehydrogenase (short-subunit alcohol dehydrogenase family)
LSADTARPENPPSQPFSLQGKTAVITGASRGIGLAVAQAMKDAGAEVALWGRSADRLTEPAQQVGGVPVVCDVSSRESVDAAFARTTDALGGVDIVVANAGQEGENVGFEDVTLEQWDSIIATNLTGCFHTMQAGARHMIAQGRGGKIITVSSMGAHWAMGRAPAYAASKAGVLALTRSAASRLARYGIQVNSVLPGWIDTEMASNQIGSEAIGPALRQRTPARRFGRPEDLAGVCVYLASAAADFHTGDAVRVDGGFLIS